MNLGNLLLFFIHRAKANIQTEQIKGIKNRNASRMFFLFKSARQTDMIILILLMDSRWPSVWKFYLLRAAKTQIFHYPLTSFPVFKRKQMKP